MGWVRREEGRGERGRGVKRKARTSHRFPNPIQTISRSCQHLQQPDLHTPHHIPHFRNLLHQHHSVQQANHPPSATTPAALPTPRSISPDSPGNSASNTKKRGWEASLEVKEGGGRKGNAKGWSGGVPRMTAISTLLLATRNLHHHQPPAAKNPSNPPNASNHNNNNNGGYATTQHAPSAHLSISLVSRESSVSSIKKRGWWT